MLDIDEELNYFKGKLDYINNNGTIEDLMEEEMKSYKNKFTKRLSVLEETLEKIRDKMSVIKNENENIVSEMIKLMENINNMMEFYKDDLEFIAKINTLKESLYKGIRNVGMEEINPHIKSEINKELHGNIEEIEKKGFNKDEIIEVLEIGYKYKNKVIKEAKVIVAK